MKPPRGPYQIRLTTALPVCTSSSCIEGVSGAADANSNAGIRSSVSLEVVIVTINLLPSAREGTALRIKVIVEAVGCLLKATDECTTISLEEIEVSIP